MLNIYKMACAGVEQERLEEGEAREKARIMSLALNPAPAEVRHEGSRRLRCFFVDGQEYPPSLFNLTRSNRESLRSPQA